MISRIAQLTVLMTPRKEAQRDGRQRSLSAINNCSRAGVEPEPRRDDYK